jgi:hypothetical protein
MKKELIEKPRNSPTTQSASEKRRVLRRYLDIGVRVDSIEGTGNLKAIIGRKEAWLNAHKQRFLSEDFLSPFLVHV